jgi:hypothetical protein
LRSGPTEGLAETKEIRMRSFIAFDSRFLRLQSSDDVALKARAYVSHKYLEITFVNGFIYLANETSNEHSP